MHEHQYEIMFITEEPYEAATWAEFNGDNLKKWLKSVPDSLRVVYAEIGGRVVDVKTVGEYKKLLQPEEKPEGMQGLYIHMENDGQYSFV